MNFAVVFGPSLWSGYALPACPPRKRHTTTATGRGSTYQARKPVQTKPATSIDCTLVFPFTVRLPAMVRFPLISTFPTLSDPLISHDREYAVEGLALDDGPGEAVHK